MKSVILDDMLSEQEIIVLDGAVASEIARMGGVMDEVAWSAVANKTHPDIVRRVHEEYVRAGANVVTANSFWTCRHVLEGAGLGAETRAINTRAVQLVREAVENVGADRPVAIAGSMSNNLAWIAGTVSPDPRYVPTPAQEAANYRELADSLAEAGADLLIMEMMSDIEQATRAVQAAVATGLPVWVGISCTLREDGSVTAWDMQVEEPPGRLAADHREAQEPVALEPIIDALIALGPQVVGIMHSTVRATSPGLDTLFQRWDGPVMAYPEAADTHEVEPAVFAAHCRSWVERGVQIIGGCCGTTIQHIRSMVSELPTAVGPRPG